MTAVSPHLSDLRLVDEFRGKRVLVLGDVMLDRYLWGRVERISPEAPVPVVEVLRETSSLGGAANVAHNLAALGAEAVLLGVVGDDSGAIWLRAELGRVGVQSGDLLTDLDRRTTVKTRIIAHQQQVVRADQEDTDALAGPVVRRLADAVERRLPGCDAVIVSDYGKGVVVPEILETVIPLARRQGVSVSIDPKEKHFSAYDGATVITPNQGEAGQAFGRRITDEPTLLEAGWALRERLHLDCVLVTRGADGMSLFERDGRYTHLPTEAREVYDVTGAGDTVIGVFSLALAAGADYVTAARLANHAAGRVIRHAGTATVAPEELKASLSGAAAGER